MLNCSLRKLIFICVLLFILTGCATAKKQITVEKYTAYNMWYQSYGRMNTLNFQVGSILPAGTASYNAMIVRRGEDSTHEAPYISFRTVDDDKTYIVEFKGRFHRTRKIDDYFIFMFADKTFEELTNGLLPREIEAIRKGVLIPGMSKKAVIISAGIPSDHMTPDLDQNKWIYWKNSFRKRAVCFDSEDKTISCRDLNILF